MKTPEELEKLFHITADDIERFSLPWEAGEVEGIAAGPIIVGRPLKFGEELRPIGFKETPRKIDAIDKRATALGMKRSDYLRWLVDKDLSAV